MRQDRAVLKTLNEIDQRALRLGRRLLDICDEIYQGKHQGQYVIVPISHNEGMIKAHFETIPTKIETVISFDRGKTVTNFIRSIWSAETSEWIPI